MPTQLSDSAATRPFRLPWRFSALFTALFTETRVCGGFLLLCSLVTFHAHGEIYKWVDDNGRVHYGDSMPANQKAQQVNREINTFEKQSYDFLPPPKKEKAAPPAVVMYATSWCPYCRKARQYFKSQGIAYTEYDIEKNRAAKRKYDALGGTGVPLSLVGEQRMSGFSPERFEALFGD